MDCMPNEYVHTAESFELACRTSRLKRNHKIVEYAYDVSLVERAVHLIRNPLDNLVGRMHLSRRRRQRQNSTTAALWEDTPEGLAAWCQERDEHVLERERKSPLIPNAFLERYASVPCHAEWFRFAQWHTRAIEVIEQLKLPVHVLYYEKYATNFEETTTELLKFLQLDAVHPSYTFRPGKSYAHLFDQNHILAAAALIKDMASPKAWNLIKHYFQDHIDVPKKESAAVTGNGKETGNFPSIGLLVSFPNSGTSYTISNTEHVSQRTTASNYGVGLYLHPYLPRGPYIHREKMELPPSFMLTKTHCMGYCDDCHPKAFVVSSADQFLKGCLTGDRLVNETRTRDTYAASLVSRVVHLFRDPFDNLIARMHLGVKRRRNKLGFTQEQLEEFSHSREGHLSWCRYVDTRHRDTFLEGGYVSDPVKSLMKDLPCFIDWYRWVQWHNYALEATQMQHLRTHYLYYEKYSSDYNKTLDDLMAFLDLPKVKTPMTFHSGKTYRDLYSEDEVLLATRVVHALASASCWKLIRHYFDETLL